MKGADEEKNRKMIENVISEVQTMSQFKKEDHPFIVNLIEYDKDGIIEKQDGSKRQAFYIVLELAQGGELFDFVASTGAFPEHVARYYFRQLMEGLDSVHRKGITHRDLKPENLLYDGDFNLKIADFGFAAPMGGRDGSSL
jgi:serine/threonine protein kinase